MPEDENPLILRDPVQFVMRPDLLLCRCSGCASYLNWRHLAQGHYPQLQAQCCVMSYMATTITPSLAMFEVQMTATIGGQNVRSFTRVRKVPTKTPNESPPGKKT